MKKTFSFLILLLLLVTGSPVFAADAILTIIPTFVDFGSVVVGEQKRITATITNQTNEDVHADDLISVQNSAVFKPYIRHRRFAVNGVGYNVMLSGSSHGLYRK